MESKSPWTEERVEQLKALWADGLSSTRVGVMMGLSRNAVIGKVHRLKLPIPALKQEVIRNRVYARQVRDGAWKAKQAKRKRSWRARVKVKAQAEARERLLFCGHSRTSSAYRDQMPKLPEMTKGELRSMLADAVRNTAGLSCTP